MDLDHLRLFLHVVDAGSVSAAARVAHLSQPAVSRNLNLLQEAVGADLFERQGRGLVLTPAGRALVPKARALLDQVQAAVQTARRAAERGYADLRMGAVDSVASYLVPRLIEPIKARFPELQWKLRTGRSAALPELVEAGGLDLAVVASSGPPKGERVVRLAPYRLQFFGRKDLFPELERVRSEEELGPFAIVEIETQPGQGTLLRADAPSSARVRGARHALPETLQLRRVRYRAARCAIRGVRQARRIARHRLSRRRALARGDQGRVRLGAGALGPGRCGDAGQQCGHRAGAVAVTASTSAAPSAPPARTPAASAPERPHPFAPSSRRNAAGRPSPAPLPWPQSLRRGQAHP